MEYIDISIFGKNQPTTASENNNDLPIYSTSFSSVENAESKNKNAEGKNKNAESKNKNAESAVSAAITPPKTTNLSNITLIPGCWGKYKILPICWFKLSGNPC